MKRVYLVVLASLCLAGLVGCVPALTTPASLMGGGQPTTTTTTTGPANQSGVQVAGNYGAVTINLNAPAVPIPAAGLVQAEPETPGGAVDPVENIARAWIKANEGLKLKPYSDPGAGAGVHIGYGRNLSGRGLTEAEAALLLENDITAAITDLKTIFPGWESVPVEIRAVLVDMRHQFGPDGFRAFKDVVAAVKAGDWAAMVAAMVDSLWYRIQTPARAARLVQVVKTYV